MVGLVAAALGPVVVHDSRERSPLGSVGERPGMFAPAPVVYERRVGEWQQFWLAFADNGQDRDIVRTGRHAGDWELIQVRDGVEAVYSQHSGAERCPWSAIELRDGRPVVYLANGSHAAYFRPGVRDRMWPDPNDEADGRGAAVRAPVEPLGEWADWPGLWGGARARLGARRDGLAARPGLSAHRPGGVRPRGPDVHVRPLRRGRRVRRSRGPAPARGAAGRRPGRHRAAPSAIMAACRTSSSPNGRRSCRGCAASAWAPAPAVRSSAPPSTRSIPAGASRRSTSTTPTRRC